MSSRVPRKQRNLKNAALAAENASVEVASSNCTAGETLEAVNLYEFYGFGNSLQTYTQGETLDFASIADQEKQVTGKDGTGAVTSIKNAGNLIGRSISAGLPTNGSHYYFNTQQTPGISSGGVTGSNVVVFSFGKNGTQAPYIPQLVHAQDGLSTGVEYTFFLPASVTGASGANMPANHSRSLEITIAGAVAPGESVQVYNTNVAGARSATGSAFTFSASYCSTPNYTHQTMRILTSSIASGSPATSKSGIAIVYSASYTVDGTKENTPYSGLMVSINPSALVT